MNFKYLCDQYQLGRFQSAVPLNPGTVAQVWRLETDCGFFLIRTLKDKEQGEREWSIHQHLRACGFGCTPNLLVPYFERDGLWYQVQEHLTGVMPNPSQPHVAAAMAKLAKRLSAALSPMIHGDLGPWNMLQCEDGRIYVIDFGAAREGDCYFDYASLFGGIINHTSEEQRAAVCGAFLRELDCDRVKLLEQLHRWAEQGVRDWAGKSETMVARFYHALNWAEEHIYDI